MASALVGGAAASEAVAGSDGVDSVGADEVSGVGTVRASVAGGCDAASGCVVVLSSFSAAVSESSKMSSGKLGLRIKPNKPNPPPLFLFAGRTGDFVAAADDVGFEVAAGAGAARVSLLSLAGAAGADTGASLDKGSSTTAVSFVSGSEASGDGGW